LRAWAASDPTQQRCEKRFEAKAERDDCASEEKQQQHRAVCAPADEVNTNRAKRDLREGSTAPATNALRRADG
jgi:hypothetical protein